MTETCKFDLDSFMKEMTQHLRMNLIKELLRDLNSSIFTTEEYRQKYEEWRKSFGITLSTPRLPISTEIAYTHLSTLPGLKQDSPGVWSLQPTQEPG